MLFIHWVLLSLIAKVTLKPIHAFFLVLLKPLQAFFLIFELYGLTLDADFASVQARFNVLRPLYPQNARGAGTASDQRKEIFYKILNPCS